MKTSKYSFTLFSIVFLLSINIFSSDIKWHSIDDLLSGKNKEMKPVYLYIYADWDGFGKRFANKVLTNKKVSKYLNEVFYCVKFNAEDTKNYNYNGKLYKPINNRRRPSHELILKWFRQGVAYPTHYFMYPNLRVISYERGFKKTEEFIQILDNLKVKRGYPDKILNTNSKELNAAISKIIAAYKNGFKNTRLQKKKIIGFDIWKTTLKIPNQINAEVGEYSYLDGSKKHHFSSVLLQNTSKEKAIKFSKKIIQILLKSNLKTELKASYLSQRMFENAFETKFLIIPLKEASTFKKIRIKISIMENNFLNKDKYDVLINIDDRNDI